MVAVRAAGGRVVGVDTAAGDQIDAPVVINAAGLWSPRVARLAGHALPIIIGRHPVSSSSATPPSAPRTRCTWTSPGAPTRAPKPEASPSPARSPTTRPSTRWTPISWAAKPASTRPAPCSPEPRAPSPRSTDSRFSHGYAGAFDITPDWMPILDESPVRGLYLAAGMSGHGFKLAPAVGEMMAALVTGGRSPVSLAPFRLDRFALSRRGGLGHLRVLLPRRRRVSALTPRVRDWLLGAGGLSLPRRDLGRGTLPSRLPGPVGHCWFPKRWLSSSTTCSSAFPRSSF